MLIIAAMVAASGYIYLKTPRLKNVLSFDITLPDNLRPL